MDDMMQTRNSRSAARDDLRTVKRRCASCDCREACELDLKRDPRDPVWESYCPITPTLVALPEAWWPGAGRTPLNLGRPAQARPPA
jgi:hypothetical protein